MVEEIVAYRLHRYLHRRESRRAGKSYKMIDGDGNQIDSSVTIEEVAGKPVAVVVESAGGKANSDYARNLDYTDGVDILLERKN